MVSQRYFETKEAHISQLAKSREDAKTELAEFCKSGMQALQTVQGQSNHTPSSVDIKSLEPPISMEKTSACSDSMFSLRS